MKNFTFPLFLIIFAILLFSCTEPKKSSEVKSDEIYQRYTCDYNSDGSGTVKAEFLVGANWDRLENEKSGGATIDFGDINVINCNGKTMIREESAIDGVYYTASFPESTSQIEMVFTDKEGKTYTNSAKIFSFSLIELKNTTKLSGDVKVEWSGSPVQSNDKVTMQLKGKINDKEEKITENITDTDVNYYIFSRERLKKYDGVNVEISAWREQYIRLEQATKAEGTIKMRGDGGNFHTTLKVSGIF